MPLQDCSYSPHILPRNICNSHLVALVQNIPSKYEVKSKPAAQHSSAGRSAPAAIFLLFSSAVPPTLITHPPPQSRRHAPGSQTKQRSFPHGRALRCGSLCLNVSRTLQSGAWGPSNDRPVSSHRSCQSSLCTVQPSRTISP